MSLKLVFVLPQDVESAFVTSASEEDNDDDLVSVVGQPEVTSLQQLIWIWSSFCRHFTSPIFPQIPGEARPEDEMAELKRKATSCCKLHFEKIFSPKNPQKLCRFCPL